MPQFDDEDVVAEADRIWWEADGHADFSQVDWSDAPRGWSVARALNQIVARGKLRDQVRQSGEREIAQWWIRSIADGAAWDDVPEEYRPCVEREERRIARERGRTVDPEVRARAHEYGEMRKQAVDDDRERLLHGYVGGCCEVGGRWRGPIQETGLRSTDSRNIRRFISGIERRPLCGMTKSGVSRALTSIQGRDAAYVQFNPSFWSILGADVDRDWLSWEHLRRALAATGLPLPHLAVADVEPLTGVVRSPHLYWLLPHGSAVWHSDDRRCRAEPRRLFQCVHRALVDRLLPLGADPGRLSNPRHGKNAASPSWHVVDDWNESHYPTLSKWAALVDASGERVLDLSATQEVLYRRGAAIKAQRAMDERDMGAEAGAAFSMAPWRAKTRKGAERRRRADEKRLALGAEVSVSREVLKRSNELFSVLRALAWSTVSAWRADADPRYAEGMEDRAALASSLCAVLEGAVQGEEDASAVVRTVARYVSNHWSEAKADAGKLDVARGRDTHLHDVGEDTRSKQSTSGRVSARAKADRYRKEIRRALEEAEREGTPTSASALARSLRYDRATIAVHLRAIREVSIAPENGDAGGGHSTNAF